MAAFAYIAIDPAGREKRGTLDAADRGAASAQLTARRLYVVKVEPTSARPAEDKAQLRGPALLTRAAKLSAKDLALFTRPLATRTLVSPIEEALRTAMRQSERANVAGVIGAVHAGVVEGRRLADAMAREPKSFPPLYRAMIAAGEASGTLPEILERLSALLERQAEVRGKLLSTLAYPIVLALVAVAVVAALMIFVVPRVVEQFDNVGQQLPWLTRAVIAVSAFAASWWWAVLIALALAGVALAALLRQPAPRLSFDRTVIRLPLVGRLLRDLHAARFARTLATMVDARLPLVEGLALTLPTIRNHALRSATADIAEQVRGGGSLSAAMRGAGVFPPLLTYLAASGESAGRLELMLARAADYLEQEFDRFTTTTMALIEPAIIILMGGTVALIILSILLPILQLQSLAGG